MLIAIYNPVFHSWRRNSGHKKGVKKVHKSEDGQGVEIIWLTPVREKTFCYLDLHRHWLSRHWQTWNSGQKFKCTGTFAVENLEGKWEDLKFGLWGTTRIFKYLNLPCESSLLKVWILLYTLSFIFIFYCTQGLLGEPSGYAGQNNKIPPSCLFLPLFLCSTVSWQCLLLIAGVPLTHNCTYVCLCFTTLQHLDYFMELEA